MPSRQLRYLPAFRVDVEEALIWSENRFGVPAADRYAALIAQAIRDVAANPLLLGSRRRPEILEGLYTFHLAFSRDRTTGGRVRSPRHFILYRYSEIYIDFGRLLHDSRDLKLHATFFEKLNKPA